MRSQKLIQQVGSLTPKIVTTSPTPTSESKIAALCINCSESCSNILLISILSYLCHNKSVVHTVVFNVDVWTVFVRTQYLVMYCFQLVLLTRASWLEQTQSSGIILAFDLLYQNAINSRCSNHLLCSQIFHTCCTNLILLLKICVCALSKVDTQTESAQICFVLSQIFYLQYTPTPVLLSFMGNWTHL